ncbi:hypothetical protein EV363DRAFT_1081926, partial [Boletus edulis]
WGSCSMEMGCTSWKEPNAACLLYDTKAGVTFYRRAEVLEPNYSISALELLN